MSLQEILNWISKNNGEAAGLAVFILLCLVTTLGHVNSLIYNLVRAITGNYPPPTHVECNCDDDDDVNDGSHASED